MSVRMTSFRAAALSWILCVGAARSSWAQTAEAWVLTPELRIGNERDPRYTWGAVQRLLVDRRGQITVVDSRSNQLMLYDAAGRYVGRYGGRGQGPGEFTRINAVGWLRDTIWVSDAGARRITFFEDDGTFISTLPFEYNSGDSSARIETAGAMLSDGHVIVAPGPRVPPTARSEWPNRRLFRVDRGGRGGRAVAELRSGRPAMVFPGGPLFAFQPFYDGDLWKAQSDGGAVVVLDRSPTTSNGGHFKVTKLGPNGEKIFERAIGFSPVPIPSRVVDSVLTIGLADFAEMRPPTSTERAGMRDQLYVPAAYPPVTALMVGRDGTIWLQRERVNADSVFWQILSADGLPVARVKSHRRTALLEAEHGLVWGVETNEDGVSSIVRYRVRRPGPLR